MHMYINLLFVYGVIQVATGREIRVDITLLQILGYFIIIFGNSNTYISYLFRHKGPP